MAAQREVLEWKNVEAELPVIKEGSLHSDLVLIYRSNTETVSEGWLEDKEGNLVWYDLAELDYDRPYLRTTADDISYWMPNYSSTITSEYFIK